MALEFSLKRDFFSSLAYIVLFPIFFFGATFIYNPFAIKEYYSFGHFDFGFHLVMLSCVVLVCMLVSRLSLRFVIKRYPFKLHNYLFWCAGEMIAISAFAALYTVLFKGDKGGFFGVLPYCFKYVSLILIIPYILLSLIRIIGILEQDLEDKTTESDQSLIRFYDEHKRLKLSIAPSSILYVKSEFNYVKIYYMDGGKLCEFLLRASMKSLEDIHSKSLVRCQRSYFVNPEHVTALRKDHEGFIFAQMNNPEVPDVPVSKQYYDSLAAIL